MPLNVTPKGQSAISDKRSSTIERSSINMGKSQTTSRVEDLKKRLSGQAPASPVAPRPTATSGRAEEMSKLKKFDTPPPATNSRSPQDLSSIEPPPSGLRTGAEPVQTPESVETPQSAPEATSEPLSPQFVALARKEKQFRKAQQEFKAVKDAWEQDKAKYIPKERLSSETLKVLAEEGITPDRLIELQINQASSQDPNQVLQNKIADLEAKLTALTDPENGELAKRDKASYDAAVSQIRDDVSLLVDSNSSYGTIKSEGKSEDVVELITRVFDEEGIVLDVEEAAQMVEDKLVERLVTQYEKISQYEKIKARMKKEPENAPEATPTKPTSQAPVQQTTLTNAGAVTRPLSARDRAILKVQEAIDRAKGR